MKKLYTVISNYNDIEWVDRCLGSLQKSEYPLKTIVVDDASTDSSCQIIKNNYPDVELVENKVNSGYAVANNIGIKRALKQGADYIFLLNMDAWVQPDTLNILVGQAEKHSSYFILSPMQLNAKGDGLDKRFSYYLDPKRCPNLQSDIYLNTIKELYEIEHVMSAAWFLSSSVIEKVGYFDEKYFVYGPDDNYADRVHYHGGKIGIVPEAKIYHAKDERNDGNLHVRELYHLQKVRSLVTAMNPNLSVLQKSLYLLRKSSSDIFYNLSNKEYKHSLKNVLSLTNGVYDILKFNSRYKE